MLPVALGLSMRYILLLSAPGVGPQDFLRVWWYWAYVRKQLPRWQAGSSEG